MGLYNSIVAATYLTRFDPRIIGGSGLGAPGLTSLFGMGRGEHRANSHQQDFLLINQQYLCECIINVILEAKENEKKGMQAVG